MGRRKVGKVIRQSFGISANCPFVPGETPQERHRRRHALALAGLPSVREWCEYREIVLTVAKSNHPETSAPEGWKWDFRLPDKFAQWRPFTGKLNLKKSLRDESLYCIKVYGIDQLFVALEWWSS